MTALRPLAAEGEPVRYVVVDDEPAYRQQELPPPHSGLIERIGDFGTVDALVRADPPCHVVVLDLCLNRQTGDEAIVQGVRAVRLLNGELNHRVVLHTADERPEPVARCAAAGAAAYVSKFSPEELSQTIFDVGRHGRVLTRTAEEALRELARRSHDLRLSEPLEETLRLLGRGLSDGEVARLRNLSPRTVEGHKRKILEIFGEHMEAEVIGFADLARELGVRSGDLVNDDAGGRPARGLIARGMPWVSRTSRRARGAGK